MTEENLEILKEKMREEGFSEEEIKNFEIKIILSEDLDSENEIENENVEIVSYEEFFKEN